MSSRAALASPIPVNTSYDRPSNSDRRKDMPSVVPPRSSSQQAPSASGNGSASRKVSGGSRSNGQASASSQSYQDERNRRSGYPTAQDQTEQKTSSSSQRDGARQTNPPVSMPVRSHSTTSSNPAGPSREASEILNSMVVSQPEEDIGRERERAALTQPHHSGTLDEAAALAHAPSEHHGEESRRGNRSRHDFSKREKHTKFGEYILGNTIGEGEFGKVKLGWKQEGGVQVRYTLVCPTPGILY